MPDRSPQLARDTVLPCPARSQRSMTERHACSVSTVAAATAAVFVLPPAAPVTETATSRLGRPVRGGTGDSCTIEGEVPIGAVLGLTGAAASYGESQQRGLELAAEQLAEKGGVTYDLTIEDDQTDPRQGITLFDEFVSQDVSLIIGPTLSNAAVQSDPIAQDAGVPGPRHLQHAAGVTEIGDYIFRDSLTEQAVIPQTIAKATEEYGLQKVVVMYSNDDAFTESGYEVFAAALEDEGVEVAEEITFSKADTDFRALLTQAKEAEPGRASSSPPSSRPRSRWSPRPASSASTCRSSAATGSTTRG